MLNMTLPVYAEGT